MRTPLLLSITTAALALAMFALLSCSFQQRSLTTVARVAPTAADCGRCHADIYQEWRASKHARAYVGETFRAVTLDHQVEACLSCHAPATVFTAGKPPETRHFLREEGVTCIVCHLVEGEHHGPLAVVSLTPHRAGADPAFYASAALCGTCHEGTYRTWAEQQASDPGTRTCQECHMRAVRRKVTQATGVVSSVIVALHEQHDLRRHTFDAALLPDEKPVTVGVRKQPAPGGTPGYEIEVSSRLPHDIPTGDFGFRQVIVSAEIVATPGRPSVRAERTLLKDLGTQLKAGGKLVLTLPCSEAGAAAADPEIRVVLRRVNRDGSTAYVIADETIPTRDASTRGPSTP